jgi:hypothetical protein
LETAPRPPLGIRLQQLLLGFDGRHSARAGLLGVILVSCQFSLGIRELGQSVIESLCKEPRCRGLAETATATRASTGTAPNGMFRARCPPAFPSAPRPATAR